LQLEDRVVPETTLLRVEMAVTPLAPRVEKVTVELVPQNLPRVLVYRWFEKVRTDCAWTETMPLAYARRYQTVLERRCGELLAAEEISRHFDLTWQVRLYPGTNTLVRVEVTAVHYSLAALGEFVLGTETFLAVHLQSGVRPWPGWEISGEFRLATGGGGPGFAGSLAYSIDRETTLGFTQVFGAGRFGWLRYINNGLSFGLEKEIAGGPLAAWIAMVTDEGFTIRFVVNSEREFRLVFAFSL